MILCFPNGCPFPLYSSSLVPLAGYSTLRCQLLPSSVTSRQFSPSALSSDAAIGAFCKDLYPTLSCHLRVSSIYWHPVHGASHRPFTDVLLFNCSSDKIWSSSLVWSLFLELVISIVCLFSKETAPPPPDIALIEPTKV